MYDDTEPIEMGDIAQSKTNFPPFDGPAIVKEIDDEGWYVLHFANGAECGYERDGIWLYRSAREQRSREDNLCIELCREAGESASDEECVIGMRGNHEPDILRFAALWDVRSLIRLRSDCGLPIFY